mgnify:CR=1 FL=1
MCSCRFHTYVDGGVHTVTRMVESDILHTTLQVLHVKTKKIIRETYPWIKLKFLHEITMEYKIWVKRIPNRNHEGEFKKQIYTYRKREECQEASHQGPNLPSKFKHRAHTNFMMLSKSKYKITHQGKRILPLGCSMSYTSFSFNRCNSIGHSVQ